ncbi:MAG: ATP-binding cassette domain-containing protein [Microbacterium sp.]|uniref:ABC transporter ATP-binding protein n=1 Tax=Microbacterium sp. TaxID=51671 RepID=UPI00271FFEF3|nr:ATP-binding cassette domain-containing protein [Microbacterium sp.]MDO8383657.1 ATP-binding cassette domain-containing protein [Microbacterium sp.]
MDIPPVPPLPPLFLPEPVGPADDVIADPVDDLAEPVVAEPVSDVAEPDVAEADVTEPDVMEPDVAEGDVTELDAAVTEEPVVEEPVAEQQVVDELDLDEFGPDDAIDEQPIVDDPIVDEPIVDGPAPDELAAVIDPDVLAAPAENATESATPALALRGVVKEFGNTRAVDAIDLTIPAGSFFGLVGPNGAGKTTTLSMIAGLLRPDSGTIEVCGIDTATDASRAKKLIGVLPDRLRTFDRLTGRQLLYYYGVLRGLSASVVQSRIADLARAFDLVDALGRVVSDYSAGMTKKVMLAGAMIHSPRVLVLDEPFESLDPASSQVILDILETYVEHGGTVVLSSHGMALVERVCTRVAVLVEGEVLAAGTVEEVRGEMTLEQRFVQLSGGVDDAEGLEWLHTFSD